MPLPKKRLFFGIQLILAMVALAAPPLWWGTGDPPVIDPVAVESNHGPANIGQAKHMAKSALAALDGVLPAVADLIEADLTSDTTPILDFNVPDRKTPEWQDKQQAPLLVGQLKAIADPFYTRLHAAAPAWLEAQRVSNGTQHPGSIFPWTTETTDDANKAIANIGQLKAVFSLRFDLLSPSAATDTDGDGMTDAWEIQNGFNPNNYEDAGGDSDNDGINNLLEFQLGLNPNSADTTGPVNLGFDEMITDAPTFSFRPTHPSDLYEAGDQSSSSVSGWKAATGQHIEVWDEGGGNRFVELQSHFGAHGITQEFWMLPGSSVTFILRYQGRYDGWEVTDNAFSLQVEGAEAFELRINGNVVTGNGSVRTHPFMESDTGDQWASWHYATVTITELGNGSSLAPIALSLVPHTTTAGSEEITHGGFVDLLPVEVVELAPKLRDSNNNEIAGSEVPKPLPESNSMVEEAPVTNKIAHRELKLKIGSALKDKRITWTMEASFTPEGEAQPRFGGDWADAATSHRDRFETSTTFGAHAYRRISQEQAETTVDADGFTAIRANLPPIGFNKARVRIQIEGLTTEIELIDLDVQAVVVIDPGHGGTPETDFTSASWNNSTSPSGVLEKTMARSYGLELRTSLETHAQAQHLNLKVLMTRTADTSISGQDRADMAKQNGADSIFIIHFNASAAHTARGTLEVRRTAGNVNPQEDIDFIDAALTRMVTAMQGFDAASNRRAAVVNDTSVASDTNLGNTAEYFPIRAGYCEVEFIDFGAHTADQADDTVDILLNTGPNAGPIKTAIANAIRDGIIHNLRTLPRTSP